jgi:hypothetical protein
MTDRELPPLPTPTDYGRGLYTADQMREYARAVIAQSAASGEPVAIDAVYETIIHWDEGGGKRSRRELARRIAALYAAPQPALAVSGEPATVSDLLRRSRNLLSYPPLWWQENEASRERLIGQLDAALHAVVSEEPNMRHPKIQTLISSNARKNIELQLVEQLLDDPNCELTSMDMEYWHGLHDKLRDRLLAAAQK